MAHFVKPAGATPESYTIDGRLAPGSVSKIKISVGERRYIGLWGGDGLWARSSDNGVAAYDDFNDGTMGDLRILSLFGTAPGTCQLEVGQGSGVWIRLDIEVQPKAVKQKIFIVRDVRLAGYKPLGDVLEVDQNTPLQWIMDNINQRGKANAGKLRVIFMAHGLPGFIECGKGNFIHPTAGGGITVADLNYFDQIRGNVEQLSIYSCLVARIGSCPECNGHQGYDGNQFCFMLAQRTQARVKASIHLQYYWNGVDDYWIFKRPNGDGINFGHWNGTVFTWGPDGSIIFREQFPYVERQGGWSDPEGDY